MTEVSYFPEDMSWRIFDGRFWVRDGETGEVLKFYREEDFADQLARVKAFMERAPGLL